MEDDTPGNASNSMWRVPVGYRNIGLPGYHSTANFTDIWVFSSRWCAGMRTACVRLLVYGALPEADAC